MFRRRKWGNEYEQLRIASVHNAHAVPALILFWISSWFYSCRAKTYVHFRRTRICACPIRSTIITHFCFHLPMICLKWLVIELNPAISASPTWILLHMANGTFPFYRAGAHARFVDHFVAGVTATASYVTWRFWLFFLLFSAMYVTTKRHSSLTAPLWIDPLINWRIINDNRLILSQHLTLQSLLFARWT